MSDFNNGNFFAVVLFLLIQRNKTLKSSNVESILTTDMKSCPSACFMLPWESGLQLLCISLLNTHSQKTITYEVLAMIPQFLLCSWSRI